MKTLLLALLVLAAPFPAPKHATVTPATKFDVGTVAGVDATRGVLRVTTGAGEVTFRIAPEAQALDRAGQPMPVARLAVGEKVRVWYVVDGGARPVEIGVE